MSLNNGSADILAGLITDALATSTGMTPAQKAQSLTYWKIICRQFYSSIKTDAIVAVTSVTGVTAGGASSGPGAGTLT